MINSKNVYLVMDDTHFLLLCNYVIYYLKLRVILLYIVGSKILCAIMQSSCFTHPCTSFVALAILLSFSVSCVK